MLDIIEFRVNKGGNPDKIKSSENARHNDADIVDKIIHLDDQWKIKRGRLDDLNKKLKDASKTIGLLLKNKNIEEVVNKKIEIIEMKSNITILQSEVDDIVNLRDETIRLVGNIVHESVPVHNDEANNVIIKTVGVLKSRTPNMREHHELLHMIGGYESERGVNVQGHRGYFLRGPGLMISIACLNYALNFLIKKKYTPIQPPYMMKKHIMNNVAQLSQFDEELYKVSDGGTKDKYLIATSEQPLTALHQNEWLDEKILPIRYAGYSTCFRKEAGSSGKDNRGIFRVHQFDKIEQFCITTPEKSWEELDMMVKNSGEFFETLGIPYQEVLIVSGALNNSAAKKIDLEGWFPCQGDAGKFRELVSCSNCTDYQARRLDIRCGASKVGDTKKYVHMLNGTLCANTRVLCCLLENHQTDEGIQLPEVLWPYLPNFIDGRPGFIPYINALPQ